MAFFAKWRTTVLWCCLLGIGQGMPVPSDLAGTSTAVPISTTNTSTTAAWTSDTTTAYSITHATSTSSTTETTTAYSTIHPTANSGTTETTATSSTTDPTATSGTTETTLTSGTTETTATPETTETTATSSTTDATATSGTTDTTATSGTTETTATSGTTHNTATSSTTETTPTSGTADTIPASGTTDTTPTSSTSGTTDTTATSGTTDTTATSGTTDTTATSGTTETTATSSTTDTTATSGTTETTATSSTVDTTSSFSTPDTTATSGTTETTATSGTTHNTATSGTTETTATSGTTHNTATSGTTETTATSGTTHTTATSGTTETTATSGTTHTTATSGTTETTATSGSTETTATSGTTDTSVASDTTETTATSGTTDTTETTLTTILTTTSSTTPADVDECQEGIHSCNQNAECNNTIGSFTCTCLQGYTGNGSTCLDVNECQQETHNCNPNAYCNNTIGSFNCTCLQGYSGNGTACTDIEECATEVDNCDNHANCTNTIGSFNCTCIQGYSGNGPTCLDIDECTSHGHDCSPEANCSNSEGSFTCSCLQGYTGDGKSCSDVNECQQGTHNCNPNAYCNNTIGSFNCTCLQGYSGNGTACTDIDECTSHGHDCSPEANCSNMDGSFTCSCLQGYTGDGKTCSDIEECATEVDNCDDHANCTNTIGSFNCTCIQGYSGNGTTCVDDDECDLGTHNCHGVAHCYNTPGSFNCVCRESYTGDGIFCVAVGDFQVSIRNISKDKNDATAVKRSENHVLEVTMIGLPDGAKISESTLQWRLISEAELAASESAEGTLWSQGNTEWTINKRSIPAGIYQVKFTASLTVSDGAFSQTLDAFDYGFIDVISAPLSAIIDGGSSVRWGSDEIVTVNGSLSYDKDIGPGNFDGLIFTWSCQRHEDNASLSNGCFGSFFGNTNSTVINIDTAQLEIGKMYLLRLTVLKDTRSSYAEMSFNIVSGEVPRVTLRCFVDCGTVVSSSAKLRVTTECLNSPCHDAKYEWRLERLHDANGSWINVPILPHMTSTAVNATDMIIKKNTLQSISNYRLMVYVTSVIGTEGFARHEFETAGKPHGGMCRASVNEGLSLETEFTFTCFDWQEKSTPLTYEFRYKNELISYGVSTTSVSAVLPPGVPEEDYQTPITVIIKSAIGVSVSQNLTVKVRPSSKLDPCLSTQEQVTENLKSLVLGHNNKLDEFLIKGEVNQAAQLALAVLKSAREKNECGQSLSEEIKTNISSKLVDKFTAIKPKSLQMSRVIMAVVTEATKDKNEVCDSCGALNRTIAMTDNVAGLLISSLSDVEEPFSEELEETAGSVTSCLRNVLQSASGEEKDAVNNEQSAPKANVERALKLVDDISNALFTRLVASEAVVLKQPDMSISLKKVTSKDVNGLRMEEGATQFKLPSNLGNDEKANINAKMMAFDFNPFGWDPSSKAVRSSVCSLELKREGDAGAMNVSGLKNDIEMTIPISGATSDGDPPKMSFLKPSQMVMRTYYAELANAPVSLRLGLRREAAVIEVLIKFRSRPTADVYDQNFTIAFDFQCKDCSQEGPTITVVPPEPSMLYVGILFLGARNHTEHSRMRRSCFGNRRERRSCVGFKDPPPKGINKTVIPQYDSSTDVNYTMSISQTSCLYWSTTKGKWTSEGCKVGPSSNSSHLSCLCNHLTAFGGNFIQAPNPIDFDKVFAEFARLGESGNISVLVTIACVFLLYFVVIIFARKADRRDENKIGPPNHLTIAEGTYLYDMVVTTGVWRNSGTTAKITVSISGKKSSTKLIPLQGTCETVELFARGNIDGFVLITNEPFGQITGVEFSHDNSGDSPSWFLETAVIKDTQTEEQWVFPANRWLAVEKDDGQISVTVPCLDKRNPVTFPQQVSLRAPRKLADSHLWMSVLGKVSSSTFTRVQRASCCLSVLFSAMIANAMFYNTGGESDGAIQVGPFKFSWKQIVIGVQSGLIVAPMNVLIVFLFRSSKPRTKSPETYKRDGRVSKHLVEEIRNSGFALPHFCVYIGWVLCFATSLTAATFTLFYSLMWGKELAEQWLASILMSLGEDVFFLQPTKAMLVVVAISLLLSRKKGSEKHSEFEDENPEACDEKKPDDDPRKYELEKMREIRRKEVQLTGMVKDIVLHLIFMFLMAVVCYGQKNDNGFRMTRTMLDPFFRFHTVTDSHRLWGWMRQDFLSNIFAGVWYNGVQETEEVYIDNKKSILIGMPLMRQTRVKRSSCGMLDFFSSQCYYDYTFENEDTTFASLPGWKPLPFNTSWPKALDMCPKPWRYQTAEELSDGFPLKGSHHSYNGGGYAAVLGYDRETADRVLAETLGQGWIDRQTRAVTIDFTVYNINTNLISIATYFYEVLATGAAYTTKRVDTLALYSTESGAQQFYLMCQFLFIAMVLFYFVVLLINLYRQRTAFVKSPWNLVEFIQIVSSVMSVAFYMLKAKSILKSIRAIQANPYEIVNFHYSISWADLENTSISVALFMATLKLLHLIRFNPHVIYLFSSFRQSVGYQLSYMGFLLFMFNAFAISGMHMFGGSMLMYSTYLRAIIAQFEFLLGKAVPLEELKAQNRIIGPAFALLFMITITIFLMNMIVSMLNESYAAAKSNVEESADALEMAHFIGERLSELFHAGKRKPDLRKLFCDEAINFDLCSVETGPSPLSSIRAEQGLRKIQKQLSEILSLTRNERDDLLEEDVEFLNLFLGISARPVS